MSIADDLGFIAVNDYLQSDGGPPEVFACGDVSSSTSHPRPKAGVYAVRAGPPLTQNIRRSATHHRLCWNSCMQLISLCCCIKVH